MEVGRWRGLGMGLIEVVVGVDGGREGGWMEGGGWG